LNLDNNGVRIVDILGQQMGKIQTKPKYAESSDFDAE